MDTNEYTYLRRSIRRSAILSLIGVTVFVVSLLFAAYTSYSVSLANKALKQTSDSLRNNIDTLKQQDGLLRANLTNLLHAIKTVKAVHGIKTITNPEHSEFIKKAENSLVYIKFIGFRIDQQLFNQTLSYLKNEGYTIVESKLLNKREPWLAFEPKVFCYDPTMIKKADTIARELETLTRKRFKVDKGNGHGVIKGQELFTIRVHLIGS